jgi:hypothetical protein
MSYEFKIVSGDIVRNHGNTGYERVTDKDKLKQDCVNTLQTAVREGDTGLGSGLGRILGSHIEGEPEIAYGTPAMFDFQRMVQNSLSLLRYNQRTYLLGRRTPKELLDDFSPVQVWATSDPRNFRWRVDFYSLGNAASVAFALGGTVR